MLVDGDIVPPNDGDIAEKVDGVIVPPVDGDLAAKGVHIVHD
ncbi:hypothetical protein A2U01_0062959 [Trifolium medium]|uniref:Uncharacterized protein n=1 Tax=Trifolium medium TaxID=97028 RepID=A0A392S1H3_9FABA|nr:hypothetical protein [Trifolium medium]